jgi:hypothetical protein
VVLKLPGRHASSGDSLRLFLMVKAICNKLGVGYFLLTGNKKDFKPFLCLQVI